MVTPLACFAPCTNENYCSSCSGHQLMCWYHTNWKKTMANLAAFTMSDFKMLGYGWIWANDHLRYSRGNGVQLETWLAPKSCYPMTTTKNHRKTIKNQDNEVTWSLVKYMFQISSDRRNWLLWPSYRRWRRASWRSENPFPLGAHKNLRFIIFPYNTSPVVPQKKWLTPSQVSPKIAVLLQSCLFIIWWLPEIGVPLIIHFKKISHYKPSSYWVPPMTMETPIYCHIICYHEYHLGTFDPLKNSGSTWWPIHSRSSGDGAGCPKTSSPLSTSWVHAGWCFENHGKHHKWIYMVIVTAVVDLSGYTNCIKLS